VRVFLVASAVAAALTVAQWALTSESFWTSVINMPQFVREVQGLPGALSLWDISILGHYGVGAGNSGQFLRAIGPFTHPVGTGHYFVAPLLLSVARTMTTNRRDPRAVAGWALLALLFAAAVITPISRGSWIAAGLGVLVLGLTLHRVRLALAAVVLTGLFVILVPPFSYSVRSAISFQDSSVIAHGEAVGEGLGTVIDNPIGLGVGQADQFGSAFAGGADAAGVGENMYLSVLVTVGPLGLAALLLWMLGLALGLAPRRDRATSWMRAALFAALAGYAVSAMTSSSLMRFTTSGSFWLLVGLLVLSGPVDVRGGIASARRQLSEVRIPSRSR
jgi:O-antigen ligase